MSTLLHKPYTGAVQSCKNCVGKISNFDNIYSKHIQVAQILQFWEIFCLWSLKNWVGKCPPCLPSSTAPVVKLSTWGGEGVKNDQNLVQVVIEWPLRRPLCIEMKKNLCLEVSILKVYIQYWFHIWTHSEQIAYLTLVQKLRALERKFLRTSANLMQGRVIFKRHVLQIRCCNKKFWNWFRYVTIDISLQAKFKS